MDPYTTPPRTTRTLPKWVEKLRKTRIADEDSRKQNILEEAINKQRVDQDNAEKLALIAQLIQPTIAADNLEMARENAQLKSELNYYIIELRHARYELHHLQRFNQSVTQQLDDLKRTIQTMFPRDSDSDEDLQEEPTEDTARRLFDQDSDDDEPLEDRLEREMVEQM